MDIKGFIEEYNLSMEATPSPANPNMDGMVKESYHFHIVIVGPHGALMTYYSVGPGIVEKWAMTQRRVSGEINVHPSRVPELRAQHHGKKYRPELVDVLDCLAMDASGVDQSPVFEDWVGDYGYDSDSIRAKHIFDTCLLQAAQLRKVLGYGPYAELLEKVERL